MNNTSLQFTYSLELEKKRIKHTLDETEWLTEKDYSAWVRLPAGEKLENIDKNKPYNYLFNEVEKEYHEADYKEVENIIKKQWPEFSLKLAKYFQETGLTQEDVYSVQLTKYGVGGSYILPNKIIFNFSGKYGAGIFKTVIHEIIHLSIESLIDKHNVDHWIKERIVDRIVSQIMPNVGSMQNLPIDTKPIDDAFNAYYPNIEKTIQNI